MKPETISLAVKTAIAHPDKTIQSAWSLLTHSPTPVQINVLNGHQIQGLLPDIVSLSLYLSDLVGREYEPDVHYFFNRYIKPNMTVIDIGAHFGYYSALSSILVGEFGKVVAFEPTPSTQIVLSSNMLNYHNVTVEKKAVSDGKSLSIEVKNFGLELSAWNTCLSKPRVLPSFIKSMPDAEVVQCKAISLDEYTQEKQIVPNFIKIDTEGYEYPILAGAKEVISSARPIIVFEAGQDNLRNTRETTNDCLDLIGAYADYDFFQYNTESKTPQPLRQNGYSSWLNILCLPK